MTLATPTKYTTPIVGVTGRAGAGKDTVCDMALQLLEEQSLTAHKWACATPLKDLCFQVYGTAYDIDARHFYGSQDDKNEELPQLPGWTGRKILQHIGTEGFRHVDSNVWSNLMVGSCQELITKHKSHAVFVSDVRFLSEAKAIQGAGGIIVRVLRPEADTTDANQGIPSHASETELVQIAENYVINNKDGTLEALKEKVRALLCQLDFLPVTPKQPA